MALTDYDPSEHSNQEVLDYLASADADEQQRVLMLEAGEGGRQRKGILRATGGAVEDGVTVELLHHWTDGGGTSYVPGAKATLPRTVAESLVLGHYAKALDSAEAEAEGDSES